MSEYLYRNVVYFLNIWILHINTSYFSSFVNVCQCRWHPAHWLAATGRDASALNSDGFFEITPMESILDPIGTSAAAVSRVVITRRTVLVITSLNRSVLLATFQSQLLGMVFPSCTKVKTKYLLSSDLLDVVFNTFSPLLSTFPATGSSSLETRPAATWHECVDLWAFQVNF